MWRVTAAAVSIARCVSRDCGWDELGCSGPLLEMQGSPHLLAAEPGAQKPILETPCRQGLRVSALAPDLEAEAGLC